MNYNFIGNTDIKVSEVGLGCEHLVDLEYNNVDSIINTAIDNGINFIDVFMPQPGVRSVIGRSLVGRRKDVVIQGHIGAVIENNQPSVSRNLKVVKRFFEDFMKRMNTDYVDIGYLHFIDKQADFKEVIDGDIAKYASSLKKSGSIRAIGLSTHNVDVALAAIESGLIDCLMFPINPAFDLMPKEQNVFDIFKKDDHKTEKWYSMQPDRQKLYSLCLSKEIGVVSMKPLGGGMLLHDNYSPFQSKLSVHQCINYCLNNPAVVSAMVGCENVKEAKELVRYPEVSDEHKEYINVLSNSKIQEGKKNCMYCNHCLPCPKNINIASVIKYYDIAMTSHNTKNNHIKEHYNALESKASECIKCNKCIEKCPFNVDILGYMDKIRDYFEHK